MSSPTPQLPRHLIRPGDVPAWLADSYFPVPLFHRTPQASIESIRKLGLAVRFCDEKAVCTSIALSPEPWSVIRDGAELQVALAVRSSKVLDVTGSINDIPEAVGLCRWGNLPGEVRKAALEAGYEAVRVTGNVMNDIPVILSLLDERCRIVLPPAWEPHIP